MNAHRTLRFGSAQAHRIHFSADASRQDFTELAHIRPHRLGGSDLVSAALWSILEHNRLVHRAAARLRWWGIA